MSWLTTATLSKSRKVSAKNRNQAVIDLKGHDFCCIFRQELSQSSNSGTDFDDIDLLINLSRIHNFLKDVGIGQEVLTEGF